MVTIRNTALERLKDGDLAVGIGLRQARTVDIAKAMRTAGFDWLFIDMEHNAMDLDIAVQISVAAQDAGITPIVRVPGFQHFHATRVLDGGAQGIVFPHVDDAETAARLVAQCRYPPAGRRSVTGALPQLDFAAHSVADTVEAVNAATLLVIMLETPTAIANADAIAAVTGVDALLIPRSARRAGQSALRRCSTPCRPRSFASRKTASGDGVQIERGDSSAVFEDVPQLRPRAPETGFRPREVST